MSDTDIIYRREFRDRVLALSPRSILEVGCGDGDFLRSLDGWNGRPAALDPNASNIAMLKEAGFDAAEGVAESLPYDDAEFDVVCFSFTPHHVSDWRQSLNEALRVARRAVCIMDVWYDERIASQSVAADYDRWCKEIDRITGIVHNDCLDLAALTAPLPPDARIEVDCAYRLILAPSDLTKFEEYGRKQQAKIAARPELANRLDGLLQRAGRSGVSQEGVILLTLAKIAA